MHITQLIENLKAMPEKMEGCNSEGEIGVINTHKLAEELKKSLRNCDVGTSEEQAERFMKFCEAHKPDEHQFTEHGELLCPCTGCELIACNYGQCALAWAQMPYEEGGSK